ncbi:MAG TPA: hypothetical protein VN408_16400 [Actinoplanes sp.]|nr:hypothetical protein [Actinoplanes sp.]
MNSGTGRAGEVGAGGTVRPGVRCRAGADALTEILLLGREPDGE